MYTRPRIASVAIMMVVTAWWTSRAEAVDEIATATTAIEVKIDAGKTFAQISPNIYGMFVEHIRNIIIAACGRKCSITASFIIPSLLRSNQHQLRLSLLAAAVDDLGRRGIGLPSGRLTR